MTTLIKGGAVYDGSGGEPAVTDILIRGKHIAKIGTIGKDNADVCIDATGKIVLPGFIDVGLDADYHLALIEQKHQHALLKQGVTTVLGGNGGISFAPAFSASLKTLVEWSNPPPINVGWESVKDFLQFMHRRGLEINFGTLVGHTTLRALFAHGEKGDSTEREVAVLKAMLERSLKDGAFGISFNITDIPGRNTSFKEIEECMSVVSDYRGVCAFHVRDAAHDVYNSVREILAMSQKVHANVEFNHFSPHTQMAKEYRACSELLSLKAAVSNIRFDISPNALHEISLRSLLPPWIEGETRVLLRTTLRSRTTRERLRKYLERETEQRIFSIGRVNTPTLSKLSGQKLESFAAMRGLHEADALVELMLQTNLRGTVIDHSIDKKVLNMFLEHPNALITPGMTGIYSDASNLHFVSFLKKIFIKKEEQFSHIIAKATSLPAKAYRIGNRGLLQCGYLADIVVLDEFSVRDVFINGSHTVKNGVVQELRSGTIIAPHETP